MIELPELVIQLISDQLTYEDLLNLRVTCKKLKEVLDCRKFSTLHLYVRAYPFERKLFCTGKLIGYANSLHSDDLRILKPIKSKCQFSGLLKLTIHHPYPFEGNIEIVNLYDLNCFEELVHLELSGLSIENEKLSLRNLKIALLETTSRLNEDFTFEIDCPRLKALGLFCRAHPELTEETSNSLEYLSVCDQRDRETYLLLLYAKLNSLSTIVFQSSKELDSLVKCLIEGRVYLPSLKQIKLKESSVFHDSNVFRNLAKLKSIDEMKHIEVLFNWKVMNLDDLVEMQNLFDKIISPQSLHFRILYKSLIMLFKGNPILNCLLPGVRVLEIISNKEFTSIKHLIGKFKNLRTLLIENEITLDANFFECLLKTCRRIDYLRVGFGGVSQQQLDLMPNYFQNLQVLVLEKKFSRRNLNLDFITKFKNLKQIKFHFDINKKTMSFFLQSCKHHPNSFWLEFHGRQTVWILNKRNENGRFEIIYGIYWDQNSPLNQKVELDSLDDVIDYYFKNKLFKTPLRKSNQKKEHSKEIIEIIITVIIFTMMVLPFLCFLISLPSL